MHEGTSLKYRKEIDGLRAIAVLSVIFFHADFTLFKGGFVGVDIFFVISGYLITTILIKDIRNNSFSLINFYERRARRILPALFFLILFCFPFVWYLMLPYQILEFARSLKFVSLFISNIFFWRAGGDGYFSGKIDEMPLLHTWSLGIEEQFYFVFLLLIWLFLSRFSPKRLVLFRKAIISLGTLSLLSFLISYSYSPLSSFFSTQYRFWELLAGAFIALPLASASESILENKSLLFEKKIYVYNFKKSLNNPFNIDIYCNYIFFIGKT